MNVTVFLSIVWALTLLYGEWFAYLVPSHWTCSWPQLQRSPSSMQDGVNYSSDYVKIAVVTDPQIMDRTSLNLAPKSLVLEIVQFYTDLYMRRAFLSSVLPFNPDVILFLGDYFDGGYLLSNEEWQESLGRFRHIFNLNVVQKTSNIKTHFLSGNHDTGYSAHHSQFPEIVKRYETEFGASNFKVRLGEVDFIAIDAQTLDGRTQDDLTLATWGFVKNASKDIHSNNPRVLLTHIPLYRPDWTPCGPHRASEVINQRVNVASDQEILYQNYVSKRSRDVLLDLIKPVLVLSGHDHDQCTVAHTSKHGSVVEHTVGTISWQQGNLYPSFMLLSVRNATKSGGSPEEAVSTHLCFLPMQLHIYLWYLSLFAMTLVIVLLWPANEVLIFRKVAALVGSIGSVYHSLTSAVKEKNDDENCEYEEIWDAEGSMHLIKKAKKVSSSFLNETSSVERGNVLMRRKQMETDLDASASDVSIQMGVIRPNRSRSKFIIWRLIRSLRALLTVAAFNVPLYVFLVFKDWIDK